MNWAVIIPAWGDRHITALERAGLPAIKEAGRGLPGRLRFIVHTDDPRRLGIAFRGQDVAFRQPPQEMNRYLRMSGCHRAALEEVEDGECVALINADMVPSVEVFHAAEARYAEGKRLVISMGIRTMAGKELPPIAARAADLLRWSWSHPHTWTTDCIYESGHSRIPSVVFFEKDGNVIMHGFHLHPFAFINDRPLTFSTTADLDLAELFTADEMHIVTSADEMSFAEISPIAKDLGRQTDNLTVKSIARWASHTLPLHQWQFGHPIAIIGDGSDIGDRAACAEIIEEINKEPMPARIKPRWQRRRR